MRRGWPGTTAYWRRLIGHARGDEVSDRLPDRSIESDDARLLGRKIVVRCRVERHSRQQHAKLDVLHARRLAHDIFTGNVVARGTQNRHQGLRKNVAGYGAAILPVSFGIVFGHELRPFLEVAIAAP